MAETVTLLALFADIDPTVKAIDKLHEMGIADNKMEVISGIPFSHEMLGRPRVSTIVPRLAMGGAMLGLDRSLVLDLWDSGLCSRCMWVVNRCFQSHRSILLVLK